MINSPWISQLNRIRQLNRLESEHTANVAVVGGGVAGISTAFFLLTQTNLRVSLFEAGKVAHGATGHNGGYLATYFERPFFELAEQFGLETAEAGREEVENAWHLLDEILDKTQIPVPLWKVVGWAGIKDLDELLVRLKNRAYRKALGVFERKVWVADNAPYVEQIPAEYLSYCSFVSQDKILEKLETENREFTAVLSSKKGCMNSALFTEKLCEWLLENFSSRFAVFEESKVSDLSLQASGVVLSVSEQQVFSDYVVLCTNGFEHFTITNTVGPDINTGFHHAVKGSVGYMAGYLEPVGLPPTALSYLPEKKQDADVYNSEAYFYLSRRPFEKEDGIQHNLTCLGGPESLHPDSSFYVRETHEYLESAEEEFTEFIQKNYKYAPQGEMHYHYKWHGLMGYTPSGVRMVGFEPLHKRLLYNLGCNGLGLLPSISGGLRIARLLRGDELPPSIFDPRDFSTSVV